MLNIKKRIQSMSLSLLQFKWEDQLNISQVLKNSSFFFFFPLMETATETHSFAH